MIEVFVYDTCATTHGVFSKGRQVVTEAIGNYLTTEKLGCYTSEIKQAPAQPDTADNREVAARMNRKKG